MAIWSVKENINTGVQVMSIVFGIDFLIGIGMMMVKWSRVKSIKTPDA